MDFAVSKILLRFLFHLELPYFFNTYCTFWPISILLILRGNPEGSTIIG